MLPQRSIVAVLTLAILLPGALPLAAGHLADAIPEDAPVTVPESLPSELDPVCDRRPGACAGAEDAMGDARRAGLPDGEPHHEPDATAEGAQHAARDHLVYGACSDDQTLCETVNRTAAGESVPNPVVITSPAAHAGARSGTPVAIAWDAAAIDDLRSGALFHVEVKSDGAWTPVGGYACARSATQSFPSGSCAATWTPAATGIYSIRVLYAASPGELPLCQVGSNCDLLGPFYVDDAPPVAAAPCVLVEGACADPAAPLASPVVTVTAGATDDLGVKRLAVVATSARGSISCDLHDGTPAASLAAKSRGCDLDLTPLLSTPLPGVLSGTVDLSVRAEDAAGNVGTAAGPRHAVETSSDAVAVTSFAPRPGMLHQSGRAAVVTFKATYASPAAQAGLPVVGEPFEVKSGSDTVCSGVTTASGVFECSLTGPDGDREFSARVLPRPGLATAPNVFTLTWSTLVINRVEAQDLPAPTATTNAGDVYSVAYRLTYGHNGSAIAASVVRLTAPDGAVSFEIADANGFVRVPVHSAVTAVKAFGVHAYYFSLRTNGAPVTVTWTRVAVSEAALDDAFVDVDGSVTLTGRATWEHSPAAPVESAVLALGEGVEGCALLEGAVTGGSLRAVVRCGDVRTAAVPLVVAASARAVTDLTSDLSVGAVWTRINLTEGAADRAVVNVNDTVTFSGTAVYVHDGSPVASATLALAGTAPAGCVALSGSVAAGVATLKARCNVAVNASAPGLRIAVASSDQGVKAVDAHAARLQSVWTSVTVSDVVVDRALANVSAPVSLKGKVHYAHDPTLPVLSAGLRLGPGASAGCSILSSMVSDGLVWANVTCPSVRNLSVTGLPLALNATETGVTNLTSPLRVRGAWTEVVFGPVTLDDAFVNVDDTANLVANVTYAHDGSPVPSGTVAFAPGAPADCTLAGQIVAGKLTGPVRCRSVQNLTAALSLTSAPDGATRLKQPISVSGIWTRVTVSGVAVGDELASAGQDVTVTARATYEHDGTPVATGTVALGPAAPAGCAVRSSSIVAGDLTAVLACEGIVDARTDGIPLAVSTGKGVSLLTAPAAARALWTQVRVAYTLDLAQPTLGMDTPLVVSADLRYAHDGSRVASGLVTVRSGAYEVQCLTNADGLCSLDVSRTLGTYAFTVTGASTREQGGLLVPDVTANVPVAGFTKRWTAIAFTAFECSVGGETGPCDGQAFAKGAQVRVTVRAVAADDASEVLGGASVRVDGELLTTDSQGYVTKLTTRTSAGGKSILARGLSATIGGETITATVTRAETLVFE